MSNKPFLFELKPHHGLCIYYYSGIGYNSHFTQNMDNIIHALNSVDDAKIKLISKGDAICKACPFFKDKQCDHTHNADLYDNKCLEATGLHYGDVILWKDYLEMLKDNIICNNNLSETCEHCSWLSTCLKQQKKMNKENDNK